MDAAGRSVTRTSNATVLTVLLRYAAEDDDDVDDDDDDDEDDDADGAAANRVRTLVRDRRRHNVVGDDGGSSPSLFARFLLSLPRRPKQTAKQKELSWTSAELKARFDASAKVHVRIAALLLMNGSPVDVGGMGEQRMRRGRRRW